MTNSKCIHYLLRAEHMPEREEKEEKKAYAERGMKVAVFKEGPKDIREALKGMVLNHV